MAKIEVRQLGSRGVTTDLNPLELDDNDMTQATNAIADHATGRSTVRKRPGLIAFTVDTPAGTVLGGIDLPVADQSSGARLIFIGRGPTS